MTDRERHIERLFRQHYRAMHRLAYLLLHDDDDSKDVVHDVFAKLLVEQTELRETTILPYLLSCVRNQCLNVMRDRRLPVAAVPHSPHCSGTDIARGP